jgi:ribosomal protein S18 acetylase RimI-like enzyme
MKITAATPSDLEQAIGCLTAAFAEDPITRFLLQPGPCYRDRLTTFFSLLMRARIALDMPVLVARDAIAIHGSVMGYATTRSSWPKAVAEDWDHFEKDIPGFTDRMAVYDEIAERYKPSLPYYYLGVIGVDPAMHGLGIGVQLLKAFCALSASDRLSCGVYLETANPLNVLFYERAGFVVTGRGSLGNATLSCMFFGHGPRHDA